LDPTQQIQSRLLVYPANHASWELPVLPAAGAEKPRPRTALKARPLLITLSIMLVATNATRGSSTGCSSGLKSMITSPLLFRTEFTTVGETRTPPFANTV